MKKRGGKSANDIDRVPGTPWHRQNASGERKAVEGGLQIWFHQAPEEDESDLSWCK